LAIDIGIVGEGQKSSEQTVTICLKDSAFPYDSDLIETLKKICHKHKIPYQLDIFKHYGSDAASLLRSGYDVKVGLIGPGIRESHNWERTHWKAVEATYKLVMKYLEK
jgi:putative aminopeptidase FrvX